MADFEQTFTLLLQFPINNIYITEEINYISKNILSHSVSGKKSQYFLIYVTELIRTFPIYNDQYIAHIQFIKGL